MTLTRISLVAAPLCLLTYGVLRLLGRYVGNYGPGLPWISGHVAAVVGFLLFTPVVLAMGRELPRHRGITATVVVAVLGIVALAVQFGVDVVAALGAADHADLVVAERNFGGLPGVQLAFYDLGPQLFYLGLLVLVVLLVLAKALPWWGALAVAIGISVPALSLDLLPFGSLALLVGLFPLLPRLAPLKNTRPAHSASG